IVDDDDVIDKPSHDLEREGTGDGRGQSVGDGVDPFEADRGAGVEGATHRVRAGRLDAHDPCGRPTRLHRRGDTGDETAAADPDDEQIRVGKIVEYLERGRPVSGDHRRVVVRVQVIRAAPRAELIDESHQLRHVGRERHLRSIAPRRGDLRRRRRLGHRHGDLHPGRGRRERDRLGRVTGAHGDDPRRPLRAGEPAHRVDGASGLERTGPLEILGLEKGGGPDAVAERAARKQRRAVDHWGDDAARELDVRDRDAHGREATVRVVRGAFTSSGTDDNAPVRNAPPAIATLALTKDYGAHRGVVDLDLTVQQGEVFGFLGPNGAGKTTTIRLLMGMIHPARGTATILGLDAEREAVAVKRQVGYVPGETPSFGGWRGSEIVAYVAGLRGNVSDAVISSLAKRLALR